MKKNIFILLAASLLVVQCGDKGNGTGADAIPGLSIADKTIQEGTGAEKTVTVDLTLSKAFARDVVVTYRTVEGTAKAGTDFVGVANGTVTIPANQTTATIAIALLADDIREGDETFQVRLSSPSNANLTRETATVTITNDDTRLGFSNDGYDAPASYPGMSLVWQDEFNGPALNSTHWSYESGDGCPALCGWGNNELQYYTNSAENLYFQDGKMIIEARQQAFGGKAYTSARIKTADKKAFKFGRIDFRALLPKGKGIWSAFWMMPQASVYGGWPRSGELDIMEHLGHEPAKVHGTLHFGPGPGSVQISKSFTLPSGDFSSAFHVFSIEWQQDVIRWYVDGVLYATADKAAFGANNYPFNEQFYFIINLAVGGNWPGSPDATTVFPQWMIVDYLRVYQ